MKKDAKEMDNLNASRGVGYMGRNSKGIKIFINYMSFLNNIKYNLCINYLT